jgi:hypothetical protein
VKCLVKCLLAPPYAIEVAVGAPKIASRVSNQASLERTLKDPILRRPCGADLVRTRPGPFGDSSGWHALRRLELKRSRAAFGADLLAQIRGTSVDGFVQEEGGDW